MNKQQVEFPGMRAELINHLKDLGNREIQKKEWASTTARHGFWDELLFSLHFIYDDLNLAHTPEDQLGYTLRNRQEMNAINLLIRALDKVDEEIGEAQPDRAYLDSPLWDEVIKAAQHAYDVFMKDEDMEALREAERKRVIPYPPRSD